MIKILIKVVLVTLGYMIISEFQQCLEERRRIDEITNGD